MVGGCFFAKKFKSRDREERTRCDRLEENKKGGGEKMKKYLLIVRCQILMKRPVTDYDRKVLGCYHEIPFFCNAQNWEDVEMVDAAYEQFCVGRPEFRHTESAELVCIE